MLTDGSSKATDKLLQSAAAREKQSSMGISNAQKPKAKRKKLPGLVKWLRTAGFVSVCVGVGGLVLSHSFWLGTGFIYLALVFCAVDVWFEPDFRDNLTTKLLIWGLILAAATMFSWDFVLVGAPLPITALAIDGQYPEGTTIAGINWKQQFTEVDIDVANPEDRPYGDLNLVIRPASPVAAIAQSSRIPNVYFEDRNDLRAHLVEYGRPAPDGRAVPLVLIATDAGYRVRTESLPAHAHLLIVMALADLKWPPPVAPDLAPEELRRDRNYMIRVKRDDFSTYWLGYEDGDVFAPRPHPASTETIRVEGDYTFLYRKRSILKKIDVGGIRTLR